MSSMTQMVDGLAAAIGALPAVDQYSTTDWLPPVQTRDTALIITPFGQESEFGTMSFAEESNYQTHRIRCELWVKHMGVSTNTMTRVRDVAAAAVRSVTDDPTLGGTVEGIGWFEPQSLSADPTIRAVVDDGFINVGGADYVRVTLVVPVYDFTLP